MAVAPGRLALLAAGVVVLVMLVGLPCPARPCDPPILVTGGSGHTGAAVAAFTVSDASTSAGPLSGDSVDDSVGDYVLGTAAEELEVALTLVSQLEEFHDKVVADMQDDPEARHGQIAAWSVDADRLMHCRIFLNSIDLE